MNARKKKSERRSVRFMRRSINLTTESGSLILAVMKRVTRRRGMSSLEIRRAPIRKGENTEISR